MTLIEEEIVVGEQMLDEEDKKLVQEVYARVELFSQANREYHDRANVARKIMRLDDPYQDLPGTPEEERTLQLQTLKSTINNCVADQMQNIPNAKILPETPELQQAADDLQDALRYVIYDVNQFERTHRRRSEDFYTAGTSITQVVWDRDMSMGKGDIAIFRWPVESFLWDPTAEDIQDARALIKVSWHPLSWYREHYPDNGKYVMGDEGTYQNVGMPDTQKINTGDDEPKAMLLEYWYRKYSASKRRYTINVAYVAGGALLAHDKDVYIHGMYPFVIDVHSTIEGQPVGDGLVMELANMQRYINKYAKYIDTNLRMSSKARMLVRRSSGIDAQDLADWSKDMVQGDRITQGEDWAWLQHAPLNNMIVQQMLNLEQELKNDSGMNTFSRGESSGGIVSGKAILALQEAGNKIANMRMVTLNQGFVGITMLCIWLMAQFYGKERMVMITGTKDGLRREVTVSAKKFFGSAYSKVKDGTMPPPYFVQVEVDRGNPARVDAMNEMYMQAYTMAAQMQQFIPLSALFRMMNVDGKDRLLPVIEEAEAQNNQLQQMQQTIEQMSEQMQGLQKENDNLRVTASQATNVLANVGANRKGSGFNNPPGGIVGEAGGGPNTVSAAVNRARQSIAQKEAAIL